MNLSRIVFAAYQGRITNNNIAKNNKKVKVESGKYFFFGRNFVYIVITIG